MSFLGAFLTGGVALPVLSTAGVVGFFTGVALDAVDVAVLLAVVVVFLAVCPVPCATLDKLPTLAI